jgi:hypothetical protein
LQYRGQGENRRGQRCDLVKQLKRKENALVL